MRTRAVGVALCIGLGLGFFLRAFVTTGVPWVAADCTDEPCDSPPCCNGDVNADGHVDVGDAIYICSYLFEGGSVPAMIPCCGELM